MKEIQELLKPRIKVTNDWPFNDKWKVGEILTFFMAKDQDNVEYWYHHDKTHQNFIYSWFNQYPHLFKPLAWYEERDQSQLPMFIRFGDLDKQHAIYKIKEWNPEKYSDMKDYHPCGDAERPIDYFISLRFPNNYPATLEDYNQYLNQQKLENKK